MVIEISSADLSILRDRIFSKQQFEIILLDGNIMKHILSSLFTPSWDIHNFWSPLECIGLWNTVTLALFLFYTFFYLFLVFFTMSFSASVFPSTSDKLESKSATLAGSYTALNMAF